MSAPDLDDPESKLKLRVRAFRGSTAIFSFGRAVGMIGASGCLLAFGLEFLPGVTSHGSPGWCLFGFAVFAAGTALFHSMLKLMRRLD